VLCNGCGKEVPANRLSCEGCGRPLFDDPRIEIKASPPPSPARSRVSISKADRDTEIGIELISLLNTVTDDGRISVEEVAGLQSWLTEYGHVDMRAIGFLKKAVEQIIADGIVTDDERTDLYAAIEKVLPPDLRQYATLKRKSVEAETKQIIKEQKAAEKERDSPVHWFDFMVAGVAHEGRGDTVSRFAMEGMPAYFARDRENRYSRNAIAIFLETGGMIGYVPETEAYSLASYLDAGFKAKLRIKKLLTTTRANYPIPVVDGEVYRANAQVPFALDQAQTELLNVSRPQDAGWRAAFRKSEATPQGNRVEESPKGVLQTCISCAAVMFGIFFLILLMVKC